MINDHAVYIYMISDHSSSIESPHFIGGVINNTFHWMMFK